MKLGKLGVWSVVEDSTARESADLAKRLEQWGYSALWIGEGIGREIMAQSGWLLANTSSLIIAPGIANLYARDPMAMLGGQMTLCEQYPGRFLLGIGVSHKLIIDGMRGLQYGDPIKTMRDYLQAMHAVKYLAPAPAEKPLTVLAALGPTMLALSRDEADGAHPYNASPAHTAQARKILGPGKLLCVEQKLVLESNPERARDAARKALEFSLSLPNYTNHWLRMGFNESDFANGGSDRLVDDTIAWGDEAALIKRVEAHWEAGADHVCIQTINPDNPTSPRGLIQVDEKLLKLLARLTH